MNVSRPPVDPGSVKSFLNTAQSHMVDAYAFHRPDHRAEAIRKAINTLEALERLLWTDSAIEKAKS